MENQEQPNYKQMLSDAIAEGDKLIQRVALEQTEEHRQAERRKFLRTTTMNCLTQAIKDIPQLLVYGHKTAPVIKDIYREDDINAAEQEEDFRMSCALVREFVGEDYPIVITEQDTYKAKLRTCSIQLKP